MVRRAILFLAVLFPILALAQAQPIPPASAVDGVALYVIPTDGVPEQAAANIARALTKDAGLWVKSALWAPSGNIAPLAGTNQYPGEDYFPLGAAMARQLQDANARTYFIVLTDRDINARSQNFRFQYSLHAPMARTSVLSVARLINDPGGSPVSPDVAAARVQKMLMRIVGEMRLGWKRTSNPEDLMYAPIMSVEDIDRMSLIHSVQDRRQQGAGDLGGTWTLQVWDRDKRLQVAAAVRFTNQSAKSCMAGTWKAVAVESVQNGSNAFFPINTPLAYAVRDGSLSLGRTAICDGYLFLNGVVRPDEIDGTYDSVSIDGRRPLGTFTLKRSQ